jgi:hypothetical protein
VGGIVKAEGLGDGLLPITTEFFVRLNQALGGSGKRSLTMVPAL